MGLVEKEPRLRLARLIGRLQKLVEMDTVCIQDPSATGGETHVRGYANPKFSGADH